MKFSATELNGLEAIAKRINVPLPAFLAVIQVESNGIKGTWIGPALEPVIRYEGHYFDRLCDPGVRDAARRAGVSSPVAGKIKNPSSQEDRWALLKKAAAFDRDAAYEACSYGVGQVMGAHWKKLGFKSVDGLVNLAREGLIGQAELMAKFIVTFGLDDELRALDWSGFARGYNGKNYKKNKYDTKMAKAYIEYGGKGTITQKRSAALRLGSKGAQVREIQSLLNKLGYTLVVDGDFGESTDKAVRQFQKDNKLEIDGKVGPQTQGALSSVRAISPKDVGQKPPLEDPDVQKGVGTAIAVPTIVETIKKPITEVLDQVTGVEMFTDVASYLHTALSVISVAGILVGLGYAGYKWYQSRKTDTGTKVDPSALVQNDEGLVLP